MVPVEQLRKLPNYTLDEFKEFIHSSPKSIVHDELDDESHTLFFYIRNCTNDIIRYAVEVLKCSLVFKKLASHTDDLRVFPITFRFPPDIQHAIINSSEFQVNRSRFAYIHDRKHISDEILIEAFKKVNFEELDSLQTKHVFVGLTYHFNVNQVVKLFNAIDGLYKEKLNSILSRNKPSLPYEYLIERTDIKYILTDMTKFTNLFASIAFGKQKRIRIIIMMLRRCDDIELFVKNMVDVACSKFVKIIDTNSIYSRGSQYNIRESLAILMSLVNQKAHIMLVTSLPIFNLIKLNVTLSPSLILDSTSRVVLRIKNGWESQNRRERHTVLSMREVDYISSESQLPVLTNKILLPIANIIFKFTPDDFTTYDFKHYDYMLIVVIVHTAMINKEKPDAAAYETMLKLSNFMRACVINGVSRVYLSDYNTRIINVFEMFVNLTDMINKPIYLDTNGYEIRQKTYEYLLDSI